MKSKELEDALAPSYNAAPDDASPATRIATGSEMAAVNEALKDPLIKAIFDDRVQQLQRQFPPSKGFTVIKKP